MSSPAPKSPEQSDKSKKYDRQLRLWGDHGQSALESSHICLINATGLGTEILKSLVLPGIGAFTIVDGHKVTEEDLGTNFFLDLESVGRPRAQIATQLLLELNPDVKGDYVDESPDQLINKNPDFFKNFTLVVTTALPEKILIPLSKYLWSKNIPMVVTRSLGLLGYVRLQYSEHTVIESHPDTQNPDLRLDCPFPALKKHMDSIDLDTMEFKDHAHIPFIIPLYKTLVKWKESHNGALPKTYKEKEEFRQEIRKGIRCNEEGVPEAEENFEEAIKAVNYAVLPTTIPKDIQDILNDSACINLTSKSKCFWIMAKAVKEFVDQEGCGFLPVRGSLPDMTADTNSYITLQQIYLAEANRCAELVHRRVQQLLHQLGQPNDAISENDVKLFCKHSSHLALLRGTCIADDEYLKPSFPMSSIVEGMENPESLMVFYVMFRGVDRFYDEYNRYPGEFEEESDIVKLKGSVHKLLNEWGCSNLTMDDYIQEICRYGGSELHSVSAFIGGCAAQEIIKLVTRQYKPINNTFIYNGITSTTETFTF